jgi:hypothetical protein
METWEIINKINSLKRELEKYKQDVEQVELFSMERTDYAIKKARCVEIILELRQLEKELKEKLKNGIKN